MRRRFSLPAALVGLLTLGSASWASSASDEPSSGHGQEAPPAKGSEDEKKAAPPPVTGFAEVVEVEGELPAIPPANISGLKSPLPAEATPASVSSVPRSLFESQGAVTLNDALRNVAGVNVATGFGIFDFFLIRGFDSLSNGLVLTDAAPEPEATFYPLYNVRQVEVLRGPTAFLYGGNPLAGAVQLVRKQPTSSRFADLSLSFGSFQTFDGAVDANVAKADGSLAFRLNGFRRETDSYRDAKDGSHSAVNPVLVWRPDARTRLGFNLEYVRAEYQPDTGIPLPGLGERPVPRTRSYQSPFDSSAQDIYRLRFDAERRLGDRVTLRNKLYYTDLKWLSDGTIIVGAFPNGQGGAIVARTLGLLDDRQKLFGNQSEALISASTGRVKHELLLGFEVGCLRDRYTQDVALLPNIDLVQPVETAQQPLFVVPQFGQAGDSRSLTLAPYVVDRIVFSRAFQVFAGGRLDSFDFEDEATATRRDGGKLSPLAGVVYSPISGLSLYGSFGRAFAPPSIQVVGDRDPEESRQLEVGVKTTLLDRKLFATVSAYDLRRENIAIPDATGITRQTGDQRSRGVEFELSAEVVKGWFTYAAYAFTDAELTQFRELVTLSQNPPSFAILDRSGNRPAFAPRHILNVWSQKQFANGLGVAAGARYVGRQFIAEDNGFAIDDYLTLDAMVSYKRGPVRGVLNFKNLTDREYEARGFGSASAIPADPFAVYAKVELSFGRR